MPNKTERGSLLDFLTSIVEKKFGKKSHIAEKMGPFSLARMMYVCYAEKQGKSLWFSSLGQMVQFDTINIRRTFVELFWSVRVKK